MPERPWRNLAALVQRPPPPSAVVGHLRQLGVWREDEEAPIALIGANRAADIVVNVLLPYTLAVARDGPSDLGRRTRTVFLKHPRLTENWITQELPTEIVDQMAASSLSALANRCSASPSSFHTIPTAY